MSEWIDITNHFSDEERHYKHSYMEIDEVLDDIFDISLFSTKKEPYEIFVSYGIMFGVSYVDRDTAVEQRDQMKKELAEEYARNGEEPSDDFISSFAEKYKLTIQNSLFDEAKLIETLMNLF